MAVDTYFYKTKIKGVLTNSVLEYESGNGKWGIYILFRELEGGVYISGGVLRIEGTGTRKTVATFGDDPVHPDVLEYCGNSQKRLPKYIQKAVEIMFQLIQGKRLAYIWNCGGEIRTGSQGLLPLEAYLREYGKTGSTTTQGKVKYRVYLNGMITGWFFREDKAVERLKLTKRENPDGEIYIEKIVEKIVKLY